MIRLESLPSGLPRSTRRGKTFGEDFSFPHDSTDPHRSGEDQHTPHAGTTPPAKSLPPYSLGIPGEHCLSSCGGSSPASTPLYRRGAPGEDTDARQVNPTETKHIYTTETDTHTAQRHTTASSDGANITAMLDTRPPWHQDAACRGMPTSWWYPQRGESTDNAKQVCKHCPVQADCLDHALDTRERFGIWGGEAERQRRATRTERNRTRRVRTNKTELTA